MAEHYAFTDAPVVGADVRVTVGPHGPLLVDAKAATNRQGVFPARVWRPWLLREQAERLAQRIACLAEPSAPFWQDESFNHWIRSNAELRQLIEYVETNPVKADFVQPPEQCPWSSARSRQTT